MSVLDVAPDITLQGGRLAYSPRQAGAALAVNAVTVKRLFDRGELLGEKIPSRGKKEFYAIYADSLEVVAQQRTSRAERSRPPTPNNALPDDVLALLQTAQAHSRIQELESQVALLEAELHHINQRFVEAKEREGRLARALALQAEQLKAAHAAHAEVQQLLL